VFLGLVMTLTSLLLAAACAHIANLLLARGMERRGEIAIRAALGARRGRIVRQLFVESVALSAVGGACSLLVAFPIIEQIRVVLGSRTPYLSDLSLDAGALAATAGMTLVASVLFGIVPALRLSSVTAGDALKQSPWSTVAGRRRSRPLASALIGLEVAIATFALILTLLYARATTNYFAIPFGFESEHVVTFRLDVPDYKYAEPAEAARVLTSVQGRLRQLPSIKATGASTRLPLTFGASLPTDALTIEDRAAMPGEQAPWATTAIVTPGYFESLSVPLLRGRAFDTRDSVSSQPVAVISRSMARAYWSENEALGRRFRMSSADDSAPWLTVIGVVDDIRPFDPTSPQVRQVYLPFSQTPGRALVFYVATVDSPMNRLQDVRAAVRGVDPDLPVLDLRTMSETVANQFSGVRLGQAAIRVNAFIAVVMAISGVYSVVAFTIARRRREIAVRTALGGTRSAIVSTLLRQTIRPALMGIALGLVVSALVSRGAALVLFGVNPLDPFTYILTAVALCLATAAASCIPALKATRADNISALRAE
jgi:putative ABC transport system permease protein